MKQIVVAEDEVIDMFDEFGTSLYCLEFLKNKPDIFLGELTGKKVKLILEVENEQPK